MVEIGHEFLECRVLGPDQTSSHQCHWKPNVDKPHVS